jgi:MoaA/NifB/PqqE/SkfB family radical SAM enzyme
VTHASKLYVELTTECNLDCAMCERHSWDSPGGRMTAETFGRVVEQAGRMPGVTTLQLSGFGEPMVHPGFFAFLALAKRAGLGVEVVTNGLLLTEPNAAQLVDLGLDRLLVSVDGIDPAGQRVLHAGTFAGVREGLETLDRLRRDRGAQAPEVGLVFVATTRNIGDLPALRRLAPLLGFSRILVTNLVPQSAEQCDEILYANWTPPARTANPSSWTPVVDLPSMDPRSAAAPVIERLCDSGARVRVNGADLTGGGPRCRFVTEGWLAIDWQGEVSPCLALMHSHSYYFRRQPRRVCRYRVGNVNDTPLAQIWGDPEYRAFRQRVRVFDFAPCIDCESCHLRDSNESDCIGDEFPRCGECLWAAGLVQCP